MTAPASAQSFDPGPTPPVARRVPHPTTLHGETRPDDYYWMREKTSPEVTAHLEAENAYADAVTRPLEGFREALYQEILGRIEQTDLSVPYPQGRLALLLAHRGGAPVPHPAAAGTARTRPSRSCSISTRSAGSTAFVAVHDATVSDDGRFLAYSLDTTGFRQYVLHVKDLATGAHGPESIEKTRERRLGGRQPHALLHRRGRGQAPVDRLYRHRLGEPAESDVLVLRRAGRALRACRASARAAAATCS